MHTDTLDQDFRNFVRERDPAALAAVFDAAAPRLLLVAMHLTRDAAAAEDLVQTVFLQVLRDAARFDLQQPVMPWLLAMLEHRAVDGRRRAHRHHEHADVAVLAAAPSRENAPTPPQAAADAELRQRVAEALAGMPGEYRQVLTLRLVHGLAAVDIAHSLGVPPATVRTRLSRGLQLLRSALPRGLATPAMLAWLGAEALRASSGLAAVRAKVLAAAGGGIAASAGLWLAAAAAATLLAVLGWWGFRQADGTAASTAVAQVAAPAAGERELLGGTGDREPREADGVTVEAAAAAARVAAADPRATKIHGVAVAAENGQPLAGVMVTLEASGASLPAARQAPASLATDASGRFSVWCVPPADGELNLRLVAPGRIIHSISWGALREAVDVDVGSLALRLGTHLVVEVRRDGKPVAGLEVAIGQFRDGQRPNSHRIHSLDASGRVDLGRVEPGRYAHEVSYPLLGAVGEFDVPLQGTPLQVVIELRDHPRADAITGCLVDPSGAPLPAVYLAIRATKWGYHTCKTDVAGRFAFKRGPLSPPSVAVQLWGGGELVWAADSGDIAWGSHDLRLIARRLASSALRLHCVDAETGAPVTNFGASCWPDPWEARKRNASEQAHYGIVAPTEHADGTILFEGLKPGAAMVSVFPAAPYAEFAEHPLVLEEGREHSLQVALRRPVACTVRVVDVHTGAGLDGIDVVLAKVMPSEDHGRVDLSAFRIDLTQGRVARTSGTGTNVLDLVRSVTDAHGEARLVVPPGMPALVLFAEGARCQRALRKDVVIDRDAIELTIAVQTAAAVRGTVAPLAIVERFGPSPQILAAFAERAQVERVDPGELADHYPELELRPVGATKPTATTHVRADGSFELRSIPPGRYTAWLDVRVHTRSSSSGQCLGPLATFDVALGASATVLALDAARWLPGRLDLQLLLDGTPYHGNMLLRSADLQLDLRSDEAGRLSIECLPPGTYHAFFDLAEDWLRQLTLDPKPIVVVPGVGVEAVVACARREVTVALQAREGAALPAHCLLLLRALDHPELDGEWIMARIDGQGVARFRGAPPGRLQVELLTAQQFDERDRTNATPLGELTADASTLRCTLPR